MAQPSLRHPHPSAQTLVMKFGGAALEKASQFEAISQIILARKKKYQRLVIVVSAMGNTTDELIALAQQVHPQPPRRELDMLVSVGERISMSLLAMSLHKYHCEVISFTGSQSGIITSDEHTEAKIIEVRPKRLENALLENKIVVVAGFQGVSRNGEITTLGRGGSDSSAVALGLALGACRVEFFKDVEGIFERDPHQYPEAKRFTELDYEQARKLTSLGHQVLQTRCIVLAQKNNLPLRVLPFKDPHNEQLGTWICHPGQREFSGAGSAILKYEEE